MGDTPKSSKKQKTEKSEKSEATTEKSYEDRLKAINIISQPLASKKMTKKIYKLIKKATSTKHNLRRGVKEVCKHVRKGEKGIVILAGDIYPIDVVSHIPVYLEENNIPYLFVPSKQDLGSAAGTKRPTSCILVKTPKDDTFDGKDLYDEVSNEAKLYDPANNS